MAFLSISSAGKDKSGKANNAAGRLEGLPLQTKLRMGRPNDAFEQEADRVAQQVVNSPANQSIQPQTDEEEPLQTMPLIGEISRFVWRQAEEEEESVQAQAEEEEEPVQTQVEEEEEAAQTKPESSFLHRQEEEKNEEGIQTEPFLQTNPVKPVIQSQEEEEENETVQTLPLLQRQEEEEEPVRTKPAISPAQVVPTSVESAIQASKAGGDTLSTQTQSVMERHFGADFSTVRLHTDRDAAQMSQALGARAFTHGSHIYFGPGNYNPHDSSGRELLAHELTHVVQQGAAVRRKRLPIPRAPPLVKGLTQTVEQGAALQKGLLPISRAPPLIQRLPDFITSRLNRYARHIPGYTLFTVIIGYNPLTGRSVARTAENLLGGLMGLVPFGTALYDKLTELGIVNRAFTFVRTQLERFDLSLERLERTIENAWDDMDFLRLDPFEYNIGVLRRHFGRLLADVRAFASSIADGVLGMIKEALINALRQVAERVPGYSLLTKILRRDPLTGARVESTTSQIIEEFLVLIGRRQHLQQMRETGTITRAANWIDTQLALLNFSFAEIQALFTRAWDAFSFRDVTDPIGAFNRTVNIFRPFVTRVFTFAYNVASEVLKFIKDALLGALSRFARSVPGYTLLTVILGRDPFTGNRVARSAINLIRGFMEFIPGGEEKFRNLQQSGAIDRAFQWLDNEVARLNLSWAAIRELFRTAWNSLSINDLVAPLGAFRRMVNLFRAPVGRIIRFAAAVGMKILEFIFEGVMGAGGTRVLNILKRARDAFITIINDPVAFIRHLIDAVVLGFRQFRDNILNHLRAGLVGWLFGALEGAGLQLPERFDLRGIISIVLQVLGLTYQRIRPRLVRVLGEPTVSRLEQVFEFVRILVTEGVAGVWRRIVEFAGNLRERIMEGIRNFVITRIVRAAVMRLATMWNPAGAVIQAIIGIYNTIMFFIERINQILALVESVVNSVANIAAGSIAAAANYIEQSMARTLPVIISFLARLLGLGNIAGAIRNIINRIRRSIDRAIDRIIQWIVRQARRLRSRLSGGRASETGSANIRELARRALQQGLRTVRTRDEMIRVVRQIESRLRPQGLRRLVIGPESADGTSTISGEASPQFPLGEMIPSIRTQSPENRELVPTQKEVDVRTAVRLTLTPQVDTPEREEIEPSGEGHQRRGRHGGLAIASDTGSSTIVEVVTWNTASSVTSDDHAEDQFVRWLGQPGNTDKRLNLRNIVLRNFYYSPCNTCCRKLGSLLNGIRREQGETNKLRTADIYWTKFYSHTTWDGINALRSAQWTTHAPIKAYPARGSVGDPGQTTSGQARFEGPGVWRFDPIPQGQSQPQTSSTSPDVEVIAPGLLRRRRRN